ncbi:hypothetical protein pdam_00000193 [Pocillopora damicornis]|uniref:Uncharacterized protein n=1 Tax=Pocillopora damicornis TaxID=46731 RepID=A0A3M6UXF2_POCDA|nr:hypothetical protein pdam_00000193 [Pocillopora damicornis]
MSVGVNKFSKAKTKNNTNTNSKIKLSSLFEAFTIGVFRYLMKIAKQRVVKHRPSAAVHVTIRAEISLHFKLFSGRSIHCVLSLLGFSLSEHWEQLEEIPSELMVPIGQSTHSQQQEDLVTFLSPGLQSLEQIDEGMPSNPS